MYKRNEELSVYWVWLNELQGLPLTAKRRLLEAIGNPMDIFQASLDDIVGILANKSCDHCHPGQPCQPSIGAQSFIVAESANCNAHSIGNAHSIDNAHTIGQKLGLVWSERNLGHAETILNNNSKHSINIMCANDPYLHHIFGDDAQAPLVVYYRGKLAPIEVPVVGIIGSRACSSYGRMVTKVVAEEAVGKGEVIASGLSFGIDALAHETTLAHGGTTYAFIPCGLHKAQPTSHAALMERIADDGAVITPYAYGKEAMPFRFIGRNALLATWCDTIIVIEARTKSGSMRTARIALTKGKRVLSVPNSLLEPRSSGTNQLLTEGAQAYLNDRLLHGQAAHQPVPGPSVSDDEAHIIETLRTKAMTTSDIVSSVQHGGGIVPVMACLADMELADKITYLSDGKWHLVGGL